MGSVRCGSGNEISNVVEGRLGGMRRLSDFRKPSKWGCLYAASRVVEEDSSSGIFDGLEGKEMRSREASEEKVAIVNCETSPMHGK